MSSLKVDVPEPVAAWLEKRVSSGAFASASDYVSELILRDQGLSPEEALKLRELDSAIAVGVADCEAGRVFDADEVFDELEAKYEAMIAAEER